MEREDVESLKEFVLPVLERGRKMVGKETFDEHVIQLLIYFGYDINDEVIKEVFDI